MRFCRYFYYFAKRRNYIILEMEASVFTILEIDKNRRKLLCPWSSMPTAFVSHPACREHLADGCHPQSSERLSAVFDQLVAGGAIDFLDFVDAPHATIEELERVHCGDYIRRLQMISPESGTVFLDDDTEMDSHTIEAALRAAGAVIQAVDLVMKGEASNAFCSVRPPGHHATRDRAMGFCFFNNVAVGTAHALEKWGVERAAIVDFDAHHGNGTEDVFRDDPRVLYCCAFQRDLFQTPEAGSSNAQTAHIPLRLGSGGEVFRKAVQEIWIPALDEFQPEILFVSAGFDGHLEDTMSDLAFTDSDYRWISELLVEVAERHAGGRLVSALEGGYDLGSLGRSAALHVKALMGI